MLVDVVQISPHTVIERARRLPLAGDVRVSLGDLLRPETLVAEAVIPSRPVVLDVALGLGVSMGEADACALRKPGDELSAGDLIAQSEGPLTRAVRSPVDGILLELAHGKAVLATDSQVRQVRAGMLGVVADVFPEFGVRVRAEGALLQGEWGNGLSGAGLLAFAGDEATQVDEPSEVGEEIPAEESPENAEETDDLVAAADPATEDTKDPDIERVLVLESIQTSAELETAVAGGRSGLVTGWLNPALVPQVAALDIPFIALFGLGTGPLDPVAWAILQDCAGELCSLNAAQVDALQGIRPELIIPGEEKKADEPLGHTAPLTPGQRVRLLSGAAAGQTGQVQRLEAELVFESGLALPAATVQLVSGEQIQVPQANLVILG
jgi:hypothetical protein